MEKPHALLKKALIWEYLTISWNLLEGVVSMALGISAGSVSLFGYGLESSVEVFASSVTIWHLKGVKKQTEEKALHMIGIAYVIVSFYIGIDAIKSIVEEEHASHSPLGILFMITTTIVMLILGVLKMRIGKAMHNMVVLADAKFTLIDAALSSTVLVGLLLQTLFGWWWVDEGLALVIAAAALREGWKELRG